MRDRTTEGFTGDVEREKSKSSFFLFRAEESAKTRRGFTLIEIILVLALIGLLATITYASLSGALEKGRISRAQADLSEFRQAIILLEHDTDFGPGGFDDMGSCIANSPSGSNEFTLDSGQAGLITDNGVSGWSGPYIGSISKDPWGNDYYFDDDYQCADGATGCSGFITGGEDLRVVHSGGPNGSGINTYELTGSDNVVLVLCVHP